MKPSADYVAVRGGGAGLIDLSERGRIRVRGSEAMMFLNGLITNDMKTLAENRWMTAAFPTVQGRLMGAVRVVRESNGFLIDTDAASHEAVLKTISRFTLAGDFHVSDVTAETAMLSVQGERALEVIEKVFARSFSDVPNNGVIETESRGAPVTIIRATHTAEDGFDVVIEATLASQVREAFEEGGAPPITAETFEILRIEAGIPRYGRDMDETNVVIETNLDDAVSYTKGCYVGQEIIVRIKHRGHVAKKLVGLEFDTDRPIEAGAQIKIGDQEIGRLTSTAFSPTLRKTIALGYVRYEHIAPETNVVVDPEIDGRVKELPFVCGSWYQD